MQPSSLSEGGTKLHFVGERGRLTSKFEEDTLKILKFHLIAICLFAMQKFNLLYSPCKVKLE